MMAGGVEQKNIYHCLFYTIMIPLSGGTVWHFSSQLLKFSGMKRQYNPLLWEKFCDSGIFFLPGLMCEYYLWQSLLLSGGEKILAAQSCDFRIFFVLLCETWITNEGQGNSLKVPCCSLKMQLKDAIPGFYGKCCCCCCCSFLTLTNHRHFAWIRCAAACVVLGIKHIGLNRTIKNPSMFYVHKAKPNELQLLLKEGFIIDEKNANGGKGKKKFKYSVAGKKKILEWCAPLTKRMRQDRCQPLGLNIKLSFHMSHINHWHGDGSFRLGWELWGKCQEEFSQRKWRKSELYIVKRLYMQFITVQHWAVVHH